MSIKNNLLGTWKLVSMISESTSGESSYPFGQDPVCYITFTDDNFVLLFKESSTTKVLHFSFLSVYLNITRMCFNYLIIIERTSLVPFSFFVKKGSDF